MPSTAFSGTFPPSVEDAETSLFNARFSLLSTLSPSILITAEEYAESMYPSPIAIALIVVLLDTRNFPSYTAESFVGVLPSVV